MMIGLSLFFGALVGISLGLTGGGGAIFAVPLLVYGLGLAPRDAVGISLAAVGTTALVGFLARWKRGEVEVATGLLFSAAGMAGAPLGTWVGSLLPEPLLLLLFGGLMILISLKMWRQSASPTAIPDVVCPTPGEPDHLVSSTCQRDERGALRINSPCAILLLGIGLVIGILSGMFGVGGGFVIVPALVLFSSMSMPRAIGTSLMVIALVSISGVTSHFWQGQTIPLDVTILFVIGGIAGLFTGQKLSTLLSTTSLQKGFAIVILAVAAFIIVNNLY
jgi:uncharacterized protein